MLPFLFCSCCVTINLEQSTKSPSYNGSVASTIPKWPSVINKNSSNITFLVLFPEQNTAVTGGKLYQSSEKPVQFQVAIELAQKKNIIINERPIYYRIEKTINHDGIEALDCACRAIVENQVLGIVGPAYSSEAKILARLGNRIGLPVVGYSTEETELSDRNVYKTFYRLAPSNIIKARVLLKLFQKYNWNSANVIYQGDSYGENGLQALRQVFNGAAKILRSIRFDIFTDRIRDLPGRLKDSSSRIVLVMANSTVTKKIIHLALKNDNILAPEFLWILTQSISFNKIPKDHRLAGMLMLRQVPPHEFNATTNQTLLYEALELWREKNSNSFYESLEQQSIYDFYAFDAAWMLILAFQQLCQKQPDTCLLFENTTDCLSSRLIARKELHEILQTMSFIGITGLVQFSWDKTDRVNGTGVHYVIDNVQPSSANVNELQIVEVLRLNGSLLATTDNSTIEWVRTGKIQWPRNQDEAPKDYALLKGTLEKNFVTQLT